LPLQSFVRHSLEISLASLWNSAFIRTSSTPPKEAAMSKLEQLLTQIAQSKLGIETL
jgi:hypothetical protein